MSHLADLGQGATPCCQGGWECQHLAGSLGFSCGGWSPMRKQAGDGLWVCFSVGCSEVGTEQVRKICVCVSEVEMTVGVRETEWRAAAVRRMWGLRHNNASTVIL